MNPRRKHMIFNSKLDSQARKKQRETKYRNKE
jgi:hypothetical protein